MIVVVQKSGVVAVFSGGKQVAEFTSTELAVRFVNRMRERSK